ncbi:MAG: hypothetical protein ABI895_38390 [Deltaproteobacteria bacterium]
MSSYAVGILALFSRAGLASAQTPEVALAPPAAPLAEPAPAGVLAVPPITYDPATGEAEGRALVQPRKYGAMLDLGVPDGVIASFVFRPIKMARVHAGLGYNGISPGLRLGAAFLPFGWGPSLDLSYGHYFEGDANGLVGLVAGANDQQSELLSSVGYDYVNLRAGMELGGDRFTFFARGGLSWVHTTLHNIDSLLAPKDGATTGKIQISIPQDPVLNAFAPSLQLGMIVQL